MRPNGQTVRNGKNLNMALAMHGYDVLLYPVALTSLGYGREVRLSVKISENCVVVAYYVKARLTETPAQRTVYTPMKP